MVFKAYRSTQASGDWVDTSEGATGWPSTLCAPLRRGYGRRAAGASLAQWTLVLVSSADNLPQCHVTADLRCMSQSGNSKPTPGANHCCTVNSVELGFTAGVVAFRRPGIVRVLLYVTGLRLQDLLLQDRALRAEGDVVRLVEE